MIIGKGKNTLSLLPEQGATITGWKHGTADIFYPQRTIRIDEKDKLRGGLHGCVPNFGSPKAAEAFGLPQHGTLRHNTKPGMLTSELDCYRAVFFEAATMEFPYGYWTTVGITMTEQGFLHEMEVGLDESMGVRMPICAGIHPYFKTPKGSRAFIGNEGYALDGVNPMAYVIDAPETPVRIELPDVGTVTMILDGYPKLIMWSDHRDYFCIEPLMGMPREFGTDEGLYLTDRTFLTCEFVFEPR